MESRLSTVARFTADCGIVLVWTTITILLFAVLLR